VATFPPLTPIIARWEAWKGAKAGLEHLELRVEGEGFVASGIVIGSSESVHFGLRYRLVIDAGWHIRDALIETCAGASVNLESDGRGHWLKDGRADPSLDGCIDIDIEATPFTNTLPIRRLGLASGEGRALRLAYLRVPSLEVVPASQRYTALEAARLYRFESLEHSFSADLPVDEHGLVRDYPGLFRRIPYQPGP
jgi:hypothetical protein